MEKGTTEEKKKYFWFNFIWSFIFALVGYFLINGTIGALVNFIYDEVNQTGALILFIIVVIISFIVMIIGPTFSYKFCVKKLKLDINEARKNIFKPLIIYIGLLILFGVPFGIIESCMYGTNVAYFMENYIGFIISFLYVGILIVLIISVITRILTRKK